MSERYVLLVRPANVYGVYNYPPLGLILIGTALAEEGYKIEIMTHEDESSFESDLVKKARGAFAVGITATTAEIQDGIRLARALRNSFDRKLPLIWGGWHTTLFPEQMGVSMLVDYAVTGDGESSALLVAQHILQGDDLSGMKVVRSPNCDLDKLALPRYDLLANIESYITRPLTDKFQEYYQGALRWLPYESSRGCPHDCAFCINVVADNRKYRCKDAQKVAMELSGLVSKYDLTHVKFIDDNFFVQVDRVRQIFEERARLGLRFTWDAECRVDYFRDGFVDEKLLRFLKRQGLVQLTLGVESGSVAKLERMRKGIHPKQAENAVELCVKQDIVTRCSFILDIPGDTREDILETTRFINQIRRFPKVVCGVHTYRPYPRSKLCEDLIRQGLFYQPSTLEGWENESCVRQYTDTTMERTWQTNFRLSSRVSFYQSLESAFWLKAHQLTNPVARLVNQIFIALARFRNRNQIYAFPLDRGLYILFRDYCTRRCVRHRGT